MASADTLDAATHTVEASCRNPISGGVWAHRPDIDGLRAVAVSTVLIFHVDPNLLPGGFVGVDIFFVISGYLISGIVLRELERGTFQFRDFYARRIRRIFPALVVVLLTTWGLGWLFFLPSEFRSVGEQIASGAAFAANIGVYRDQEWYFGSDTSNPLLHLWSLGVEEQFYAVWPVLLMSMWNARGQLVRVILLVTGGSFFLNILSAASDPVAAYYLPWNRLWELSAGSLLAYAQLRHYPISYRSLFSPTMRGLAGACMLLASFLFLDGSGRTAFPSWWGALPVLGTVLIISAGTQAWIGRCALASRPATYVGLISYPLYLWHLPLLALVHKLGYSNRVVSFAALATAFALAALTYKYVELPIRRRASLKTIAALAVSMTVCAALGSATFFGAIDPLSKSYAVEKYDRPSTEDWLPIDDSKYSGRPHHWTLGVNDFLELGGTSARTLYIGDSFIQQYYQRVADVLAHNPDIGRGAVFAVRAGCVPGGVELLHHVLPDAYVRECGAHLRRALHYAQRKSIDTVVIGGSWFTYFSVAKFGSQLPPGVSPWRPGSESGLQELQQVISNLVRADKRVFLILSHPAGPQFEPTNMVHRKILPPAFNCRPREFVSKDEIWNGDGQITARVRRLAEDAGARIIDPSDALCIGNVCRALTPEGEPIYHDGGHLRPSYLKDNAYFLDQTLLNVGTSPQ